jgi:TM2 domain-containing membrane protein YozV
VGFADDATDMHTPNGSEPQHSMGQPQSMVPHPTHAQPHPSQYYGQGHPPGYPPHPNGYPPAYGYPPQPPVNVVVQNTVGHGPSHHGGLVRVADRQKSVAVLLALFLGGLGVHRFYLGQTGLGVVYLIFCWTFIPVFVALVEALILLLMSSREFDMKYNCALA